MRRLAGLTAIIVLVSAAITALNPAFASRANLLALVNNTALEMMLLGPLTLLLVAGLFDLSIDGTAALTGVAAGLLMKAGAPWPAALAVGLGIGLAMGAINGLAVSRMRLNALVVTLATWWIAAGAALGLTKGLTPFGFPKAFQALGQLSLGGVRISVLYAVVIVGVCAFVLALTKIGAHIYIIGDNRDTADLMGLQVKRIQLGLYMVVGVTAALVGLVLAARLDAGTPNAVDGTTLRVIAAAVIGGCSLSGGKGYVLAGLLGLILMNMLTNGATLLGVSPYWQRTIIGVILFGAIALSEIRRGSYAVLRVPHSISHFSRRIKIERGLSD